MKLIVIIINWNNAQDTIACAQSVYQWHDLKPFVWIVDNGSSGNDISRITRNCPYARIFRNSENLGFSAGNNTAIRYAIAENCNYIMLLNNDAKLPESSAKRLIEMLERDPKISVIGPVLRETSKNKVHFSLGGRNIGHYLNTRIEAATAPPQGAPLPVDYVPGTAVLLRSELFRHIGYFDERYFFSGEMADLCRRAQLHGYGTALLPGTLADHDINRSSSLRSTLYAYYNLRNRFLYVTTFETLHRRPLWKLFWITCGCAMIVSCLSKKQKREARALWLAVLDGCSGRFGKQNERLGA